MGIMEQIEIAINDRTGNNIPPEVITINKAYSDNTCDITTSKGVLRNIQCSGLAVEGAKGLLVYEDGEQDKPFVILFEDAETTITSLGLGKFHIYDGDLYVELPEGVPNPFSINEDGDLIVEIPEGKTNNYSINNDGDLIYDRWDF